MCRAMPESDLVIELLHFDPDNYRLENAIRDVEATVTEVTELTHDIVGVTLTVPEDFSLAAGSVRRPARPGRRGRAAVVLDRQPARRRAESS